MHVHRRTCSSCSDSTPEDRARTGRGRDGRSGARRIAGRGRRARASDRAGRTNGRGRARGARARRARLRGRRPLQARMGVASAGVVAGGWMRTLCRDFSSVEVERPDVEIVGAGITGISAALTLAAAGKRVRVHDARRVAEGASGRNGGFALRGGAMPYDRARESLGAERAAEFWRLTELALDRLAAARAATRSRGPAACASPRTMRNATRSGPSSKRSARTASKRSGGRTSSAIVSRRRSFIRATRPSNRRGSSGGSRLQAAEAGVAIRRAPSRRVARRARGRAGPRRDRRLPERPARDARGS